MNKYIGKLALFLLTVAVIATGSPLAGAYVVFVPGETDQEVAINSALLESDDEASVFTYLNDSAVSVRWTACNRLQDIGTIYSISTLFDIAAFDSEDYRVKEAANLAAWTIAYNEEIRAGGNGEGLLLSAVDPAKVLHTKTQAVIRWAIELLGDMGSRNAVAYLEALVVDPEASGYIKQAAQEALIKIDFITATPAAQLIELGLENEELCVRNLALRKLVKANPSDLLNRLNILFEQANTNQDYQFAYCIAETIEREVEYLQHPPIEFEYPQEGVTIKAPYVDIFGFTYGESFHDIVELASGWNTYTKTVTDRDGQAIAASIQIYHENKPPVLEPIGNKQVYLGKALSFAISATDPDDANLVYYFESDLPQEAVLDAQTQTFSWTPTPGDLGTHTAVFMAWDGYGLVDEERVTIEVLPPKLAIIAPAPEATVTGEITINVTSSDLSNFSNLIFYCDNKYLGSDYLQPYQYTWNTAYFANGNHTLKVLGFHNGLKRWIASELHVVEVNNAHPDVPAINIANLIENQTISGAVSIQATATHPNKMFVVIFMIDNQQLLAFDRRAPFEANCQTENFSNGPHSIKAIGYFYGPPYIICEDIVGVNIENVYQNFSQVKIANLSAGQEVSGNVVINVTVNDPAYMKYVWFYVNGQYLGYDSSVPFQSTWNSRSYGNGRYTLKVKTYHYRLRQWYESEVTVTLNNGQP